MSNYQNSDGFQKTYTTKDVVIASGGSLSGVVDLEQLNIAGFLIPASWTTAKLTFQVSPDGVTFGDAQDSSGNELQATVAAGKFIGVNLSELSGVRFVKVRSGTSGVPVNQGADRTISIVLTNNAEASAGGSGTVAIGDGTNSANILKGDGTAAGQNSQLVAGAGYATAVLTLNSGSPNTQWFDMLNYAWVSIQVLTNTTPATLQFQTTGDPTQTIVNNVLTSNAAGGGPSNTTTSTSGTFYAPRTGRYFRIGSNVAGGNTVTLVVTFFALPAYQTNILVNQNGTWTVNTKNSLTAAAPAAVSVGTSTGAVVASNANRKGLVLVNTSANNISLGIGAAAVLNSGITLVPNDKFIMSEYNFSTAAINAIAAGAASNLAVQEFS